MPDRITDPNRNSYSYRGTDIYAVGVFRDSALGRFRQKLRRLLIRGSGILNRDWWGTGIGSFDNGGNWIFL